MFAARQRAVCAARQLQRAARTYASDAHAHHSHAPVNESFGTGSILTVGTIVAFSVFYQFIPKEGESSAIMDLVNKYSSRADDWAELNALHTKAAEQAGFDRNLFENGGNKHRFVDVAYPEALTSHAARNIRAGHMNNIDSVVEHYRQEHLKCEERKVKKLEAAKAA